MKKQDIELKKYLEVTSNFIKNSIRNDFKYSSVYDFLLVHGKNYQIKAFPEDLEDWKGVKGYCWHNAGSMVLEVNHLTYCEGYALAESLPIPLPHSWAIDPEENVVDPTWNNGISYFGVPFDLDYVMFTMLERGYYASVIDFWEKGFQLLKGNHVYLDGKVTT